MDTPQTFGGNEVNQRTIFGHPSGLFVLFFTEMWERFSYYGMRAILVLFLTSSLLDGGWAWSTEKALALYGTYTALVYIVPIAGGWLADRFLGYRLAVILGALAMTLGHGFMAFETQLGLYAGITALAIGTGLFKPNMTSIISEMYKHRPDKKDGAYTIFYMGVNAGAFFGIMLCGYLGEKVGWSYGFGLAGVFMLFGLLQFHFARKLFGEIGATPTKEGKRQLEAEMAQNEDPNDRKVPFTLVDKLLIVVIAVVGLTWVINDPVSKINGFNLFDFYVGRMAGENFVIIVAVVLLFGLLAWRISRYTAVVRDRMIAIAIFGTLTVFFWMGFEQHGGSMTLFAEHFTARTLSGTGQTVFAIIQAALMVVPLAIITWVLAQLFGHTFKHYSLSNVFLGISFLIIWGIVIWVLNREFNSVESEIPATWFSILNSFFIITLAPLFSKWWDSRYNPTAPLKYALGFALLGLGFGSLMIGASVIPSGASTAQVSIIWLILAYLFHTMGELCQSPVGLSYVSKLVPGRMIGIMFGVWYLAMAIGNKSAATLGGKIDQISEEHSLQFFFGIFFVVPMTIAVLTLLLSPLLKKLMHGVR